MARDASQTREQLLTAGQRLFARHGAYAVPIRQIVAEAGQRNESALHYHFGSRTGLLMAIVARHNEAIEAERAVMLAGLEGAGRLGDTRALVEALVVPWSRKLGSAEGREFLHIVSELRGLFDSWHAETAQSPPQARRVLGLIAASIPEGVAPAVRLARVTMLLGLLSEALAERARRLDRDEPLALDDATFIANVVDVAVGALTAPTSCAPGAPSAG